jgi:PAS domain S-box-containing protein
MQSKPRRSAENNFITLLNFIADPAIIVDGKGCFLVVNDAFMYLTGLRKKELIGTAFLDLSVLTAENKAILFKNLEKRMKGVHVEPYEISFTNRTGETRCAEVKAKKIDYGGQLADLVTFRDITRRKENARRLKKYSEKMETLVNEKVKEIEESEKKYRELINGMNDTAWVIDLDAKFIDVNDAAVKVLGYSREELLRMGPTDIDSSLTKEQIRDLIRSMPADQIQVFETSHTTKDGKTIPVEISSSLVTYQEKQAILSIARNITERKQMEKVLRESEEKYRTQFEEALDAILVADAETGIIIDCNRAATKLVGREKSEIVGNHQRVLHPPEVIKGKFSRTFKQHRKEKEGQLLETQVITKNGEIKDIAIKANVFKLGNKRILQGIFRDITEQKNVEKALREAEEKYRKTIVNANVGIIAYDPEGKVNVLNPKMEEMTGFTRKEIPTLLNWFEKLYPNEEERRKVRDKWLKRMSEEGEVKGGHAIITTKEGKHRNFLFNGVQLESGDSIAFAHDITERKKAEEKLLASEKRYRRLFKELKRAEKQLLEERDRAQNYLDIADVMLVALDTEGRITMLNRKGCAILKCEAKEALGKSWFDTFLPKKVKSDVKRRFKFVLAGKASFSEYHENPVLAKNRDIRLIGWHHTVLRNNDGRIIGTLSSGEDITEWKQAQQALADSEEKFRTISTSAMDAIILLDDTGKITYWNPAAERIFGYTNEEAVGKKLDNLIIPAQYQGLHSKSAIQAFKNEQIHKKSIETKALRKNGTKVPIEISVAVLKIKDKKHLLGIIRDSSEREKMEMTLREAEKRYHALFDKAPLGILLIDPETATAVEFNEEAHRQLGYTREEFAKLAVSDYEVLETPRETRAHMKKILREGRDEFETKHRTRNGEIRDVINTMQVIELSGKKLFHLITRDVTEQKKIEHELEIERDNLEAVTENIGAGLAIISKDYYILWANKLLKQLNGDCEGKMCYSTFHRLTDVCPECGVKKVFENGATFDRHEYSFKDNKGNTQWIELIVTPIKDENGNVTAALELAVNIAERKRMQNKLAEYSQKLEKLVEKRTEQLKQTQAKLVKSERLATIGELAAMVGHDLRNPLTGIMGAAYYLKTKHGTAVGAKGREMLETIENAINYSNKIINDLLEYSQDLKLKLTETTPKTMLQSALSLLEIPEKIQIIDATKAKPTVKADTEKIRQVFVEIIQNAIDAMPEGGTLTIKSRKVKDKLEIAFKDTGTGMSEEALSKLKGGVPLFTTKSKGMGFGLPICKRIVEAHGGKICVKSTAGKGATVTVTIPVNPKSLDEGEEKWIFNESMLSAMITAQKAR